MVGMCGVWLAVFVLVVDYDGVVLLLRGVLWVCMGEYFDDSFFEDRLIKDITYLKAEYQPESIDERDEQLNEYVRELSPIMRGWDTDNIFLFGDSGVGKTLATRILLPELREKASDQGVDVDIIETNCSGVSSSYQATISIVNEMYDPSSPITTINLDRESLNNTGYPSSMVYSKLFEALSMGSEYLILVLDEIDEIGTDGELLYQLTRGQSMGKLDSEVCIIGISNDLYFKNNLKTSVKDTLCESEIHFPSYEADDLGSILSRRARKSFYDESIDDGVIPLCSAIATQDQGSARYAIRILRKAGQIAENDMRDGADIDSVTENHVRKAQQEIEKSTVRSGIRKLNNDQRLLLAVIVIQNSTSTMPVDTSTIYDEYLSVATSGRATSRRGVHNKLLSMVDKGIIEISNKARNKRGVPNKYSLVTDTDTIISALESLDTMPISIEDYV